MMVGSIEGISGLVFNREWLRFMMGSVGGVYFYGVGAIVAAYIKDELDEATLVLGVVSLGCSIPFILCIALGTFSPCGVVPIA